MNVFITVFNIMLIYMLISFIWQVLEKVMYGEITTRSIDDIFALILAISIYYNIK